MEHGKQLMRWMVNQACGRDGPDSSDGNLMRRTVKAIIFCALWVCMWILALCLREYWRQTGQTMPFIYLAGLGLRRIALLNDEPGLMFALKCGEGLWNSTDWIIIIPQSFSGVQGSSLIQLPLVSVFNVACRTSYTPGIPNRSYSRSSQPLSKRDYFLLGMYR